MKNHMTDQERYRQARILRGRIGAMKSGASAASGVLLIGGIVLLYLIVFGGWAQ